MTETVTIRERTPEDDPAIVAIRNESNPHQPPVTLERYRHQANPALVPDVGIHDRFLAVDGGEVVGLYFLGGNWFYQRPHTFQISPAVRRSHRGRGIGRLLYDHLLDRAQGHGATRLYVDIVEGDEDARGFAERRGFAPNGRVNRHSRLSVSEANLAGTKGIEERLKPEGIEIKLLSDIGLDDGFLRRLHAMEHEAEKDIPSAEEWTMAEFDTWKTWLLDAPGHSASHTWVAVVRDRPVGVAALQRSNETTAYNGLTATAREFRGKGLAKAMKRRQVEWCREQGITHIFTSNDIDNAPMLAVNIGLGYKPVPNNIELFKDL